jgi:hypothetical protein
MDRISELKSNSTFGQFVGKPQVIWPSHSEISTEKSACVELCKLLGSVGGNTACSDNRSLSSLARSPLVGRDF